MEGDQGRKSTAVHVEEASGDIQGHALACDDACLRGEPEQIPHGF